MNDVERLKTKLKNSHPDADTGELSIYLEDATDDLKLYLGYTDDEELPDRFRSKRIDVAKLKYEQDHSTVNGINEESYTEGQVSESKSYFSGVEFEEQLNKLYDGLKRFRRVGNADRESVSG